MIRNFNADGFGSLYPKYKGGRPPKFTLGQRREVKKIAKSRPAEHGLPFSAWSLSKLAEFLVAEGVVDDISHEGLRTLLREEGVTFQRIKTWRASEDPDYSVKKARVEHLYAIADREVVPDPGEWPANGPVIFASPRRHRSLCVMPPVPAARTYRSLSWSRPPAAEKLSASWATVEPGHTYSSRDCEGGA